MSDRGPLVPQLTPNLENISIGRTASLTLIKKKYHANLGVNLMKNCVAAAAYVKFKCYSFTIVMAFSYPMYYLKATTMDRNNFHT